MHKSTLDQLNGLKARAEEGPLGGEVARIVADLIEILIPALQTAPNLTRVKPINAVELWAGFDKAGNNGKFVAAIPAPEPWSNIIAIMGVRGDRKYFAYDEGSGRFIEEYPLEFPRNWP